MSYLRPGCATHGCVDLGEAIDHQPECTPSDLRSHPMTDMSPIEAAEILERYTAEKCPTSELGEAVSVLTGLARALAERPADGGQK